jgi:inosine-uridine nucleoside N-ribohydrolase
LAANKVKLLSVMGGDFGGGYPEYNIKTDIAAARKVAREWPTPIFWSGFELGRTIKYPAASIEHDFGPVGAHPVADAYRLYMKMPYDRETWDLTAVLYALRPDAGYFQLSPAGRVEVDEQGNTKFVEDAAGTQHYLIVDDLQRARIGEAFLWLCTQPRR